MIGIFTSHRLRIMECLIGHGPMTRGELSARIGLSPASLSEWISELSAEGLVLSTKQARNGPGRPRDVLSVHAKAGHVVGIKLSMHEATLALTDFSGKCLGSMKVQHIAGAQKSDISARHIAAKIRNFIRHHGLSPADIAGIGLGLPGFIESPSGKCLWSPVFSSKPNKFIRILAEEAQIPVLVDNDVNLVCLAERWFGRGRDVDPFMVISLEHGLGMGLWLNGGLYRGPRGIAAELAHIIAEPGGALCRCGRHGCLEAYVSDQALASRAAIMLGKPVPQHGGEVHRMMADVTAQAMAGNGDFRKLIAEAGERLGLAVANAANLLAPKRVIVTGEAMRAEDLIMRPFSDAFMQGLIEPLRDEIKLSWHPVEDEIWAQGAAARVLSERFAGH